MIKIGIVGCGAIGSEVALAIDRREIHMELCAIYDVQKERAIDLKRQLQESVPEIPETMEAFVSKADLIFEATHLDGMKGVAEECLKQGKDLFVMSVGGLILYPEILEKIGCSKCKISFPSGGIAGLDGMKALKLSGIESVMLKSTKPLKALVSSPGFGEYLKSHNTKPEDISDAVTIFDGNVNEAVPLFPQNVNVGATLAIVGIGPEKTRVKVVADPHGDKNIHEITCLSKAGSAYFRTENVPYPKNPKTSYLAILSAISKLKEMSA